MKYWHSFLILYTATLLSISFILFVPYLIDQGYQTASSVIQNGPQSVLKPGCTFHLIGAQDSYRTCDRVSIQEYIMSLAIELLIIFASLFPYILTMFLTKNKYGVEKKEQLIDYLKNVIVISLFSFSLFFVSFYQFLTGYNLLYDQFCSATGECLKSVAYIAVEPVYVLLLIPLGIVIYMIKSKISKKQIDFKKTSHFVDLLPYGLIILLEIKIALFYLL